MSNVCQIEKRKKKKKERKKNLADRVENMHF